MDYAVQPRTRRCAASDRPLEEGETFYSVLADEAGEVRRYDYAADAWQGPPEGAIGWWKSRIPTRQEAKAKLAPDEVLAQLFHELADRPQREEFRYVLGLLLARRRVFRLEEPDEAEADAEGGEAESGDIGRLVLYCPRRDETYRLAAPELDEERIAQIQEEINELLYAESDEAGEPS